MPILRIATGCFLFLLVGKAALRGAPWARPRSAAGRCALEGTLGLALLVPLLFFAALIGWPINAAGIIAFALLMAAALAAGKSPEEHGGPARSTIREGSIQRGASRAIVAAALALFTAKVACAPLWSWDHYAVWGVKARRLAAEGGLDLSFLQLASFFPSHPDNPLGLPLVWRALCLGSLPEAAAFKCCHVLFGLALVALVREAVLDAGAGETTANIFGALTAVSPLFWDTESLGIAEMPLALAASAGFWLLLRLRYGGRGWLAGAMLGVLPWIKGREGVTLGILGAAAGVFLNFDEDEGEGTTRARRAGRLFLPLMIGTGAAYASCALLPPGERFLAGDWRSRGLARLGEAPHILGLLGKELLRPDWLGFWAVFAILTAAAAARRKEPRRATPTMLLSTVVWGQIAVYSIVYFVTYLDPAAHIQSSFFRIAAALVPLGMIAAAPLFTAGTCEATPSS